MAEGNHSPLLEEKRKQGSMLKPSRLFSIPRKLFAMILLERIRPTFHNHRRSEQAGFTAGRSTTEHIFAIRQIIEIRRNLISLPTLLLSTSKLPLTQCPVNPCGKFFKSVAYHRNVLFLCVNCTQTLGARCASLLLCQKSSPSRLA